MSRVTWSRVTEIRVTRILLPRADRGNTLYIPPCWQRAVLWVWWHGTAQVCIWRHKAPCLTPAEGHSTGPVSPLLDKRLVELSARPAVDGGPALLAVVLKIFHQLKMYLSENKNICSSTCKQVTLAQKKGANLPPQRPPWHSSHSWSSRT